MAQHRRYGKTMPGTWIDYTKRKPTAMDGSTEGEKRPRPVVKRITRLGRPGSHAPWLAKVSHCRLTKL